jgi:hypothetical protein
MGDDENKVDYEIQTTLDEAVSKLEGLVAGLKSRHIILRNRPLASARSARGAAVPTTERILWDSAGRRPDVGVQRFRWPLRAPEQRAQAGWANPIHASPRG